jgi:uncharacterized membrane protein
MIFWYSKRQIKIGLLLLFFFVVCISCFIPPLQSPDEPAHLSRAYLLSKGEIFLGVSDGVTGGKVDSGLLKYLDSFTYIHPKFPVKVIEERSETSRGLRWSNEDQFIGLPNTAAYFPISYAPQAIGIILGKSLDLSINQTYYLCRLASLVSTLALLFFALGLYAMPPLVIACFLTPMTIFQMGTASLDAVSFGSAALATSLFMRGCNRSLTFTSFMHWSMTFLFFSIATTRLNFIFLTLLPAVLYFYRQSIWSIWQSILSFILATTWGLFALISIQGLTNARSFSTVEIIRYYIQHPFEYFRVLFDTLRNRELIVSYWKGFIGHLGWADTLLNKHTYLIFFALFLSLGFLTFRKITPKHHDRFRIFLFISLILSFFSLFTILLFAWSRHPTLFVEGIQGRYFIPLVILIGYGFFDKSLSKLDTKMVRLIFIFMIGVTLVSTLHALLSRY